MSHCLRRLNRNFETVKLATSEFTVLSDLIPHLLEHLLDLMQLDRPLTLALILAQDMDLAARDLVALDGAFLCVKGAHVANEGLGDLGRQFDRFARHEPRIGTQAANRESRGAGQRQPSVRVLG